MKYIIFYSILPFSTFLFSQQVIDSNEQKIEFILDSAFNMCKYDDDMNKAMNVVDVGLKLIEQSPKANIRQCIKGLYIKGRIYENQVNYKSEYEILDSAILLSEKHNLDTGSIYGRILLHFANSCIKNSNYHLSYKPLMTSKRIFNSLNDKNNGLLQNSYLIEYYYHSNQFEEGDKLIQLVENNLDSTYDSTYKYYFYKQVADFYWKLNIFDKANFYQDLLYNHEYTDERNKCALIINKLH
ncbi:MAG: hypothetical protein HOP11_14410, partial [Saprospiraceae bacterium]|nr:hypothetical protein [Saprospiraceae bacterium]